ncbi:MAG: CNNM domain-containing protein [Luteolibacter sp.]
MILTLLVVLSLTLILVNFICAIIEVTLISLNPLDLKLDQSRGFQNAGRWLALKSKIERPLAAILIFDTLASTGLATLTGALFVDRFGNHWLWLYSFVLTLSLLFLGELAPKILGVHYSQQLAAPLLRPLEWMLKISHPLVVLMDRFTQFLRPRATSDQANKSRSHILDILTLVEAARAEQSIHSREEIIIIHAVTLSARRVCTVMVPAEAVVVFDERKSLEENLLSSGSKIHRSYPVSPDGTLQNAHGYLRIRDALVPSLLNHPETPRPSWQEHIRPLLRISGHSSLTQLLAAFLENRDIAALVENRTSTTIGWITMDDVTETLMGARD